MRSHAIAKYVALTLTPLRSRQAQVRFCRDDRTLAADGTRNVPGYFGCGERTNWGVGGDASQPMTGVSQLPLAMRLPSGLKATLKTESAGPLSVRVSCPVVASQILIVWSWLPLAMRLPAGLKA